MPASTALMCRIAAGLLAWSCMNSAFALGMGEMEGRAIIGRSLQLAIPILGDQVDPKNESCVTLLPEGDDDAHSRIRIKVEGRRIHLSTAQALNQPILQFRVRLGCSGFVERSYTVLADPPQSAEVRPPIGKPAAPTAAAPEPDLPQAAPPAPGQSSLVLASSTSLRMLSRQRYPGDSRLRVSFIRQVAAVNPDLFASEQAAFDQRLAVGTRLVMPAGLPPPRASAPARKRPTAGSSPVSLPRAAGSGRGRLIVGTEGLSGKGGPSAAELNESIDRLIEVMNQQVQVQMALTERIKAAEAELTDLKRLARAEQQRAAQLESQLKAAREQVERGEMIQLLLLILLAGLGGAWGLQWVSRRKAARSDMMLSVAVAPAPTLVPERRTPPKPAAFADLFESQDARDDILPPESPR